MTLPKIPSLHPYSWAALALVALTAILVAVWLLGAPGREAATAAKAKAGATYGDARTKSAADAAVITDRATKAAAESETLTRENADAIRNACPGPDCNRTALERLCQRPAYRGSADCLQLARRPQPPG